MNHRTRTLAWIAGALATLAVVVPAAQAGHSQPAKRGLADAGVAVRQPVEAPAPATLKRGCTDFGLVFDYSRGCVSPRGAQSKPAATGFDWRDAGIGAGTMLGVVLIAVGLGSALVVRAQQRQVTDA
jgi:hypothetical protein